jgi:CDP-6-deoxy-D-xylo-4-hexulose-3-dehydrase
MIKLVNSTFVEEHQTKQALCEFIMNSDKLSMGEQCALFERNFAHWQQARFSILVNSGSSANLLLVQAMLNSGRWKLGDRIGVSAVTWSTNVMPLIQLGLLPVLIDVDLNTLNINRSFLTRAHEKHKLKGLFVTNCLGLCPDLPQIHEYCAGNAIDLIEDNCESMGSVVAGKKSGNFGLGSTFSLFVGHHMSAIEGGIVCTDDEEFYHHLCIARAHGWTRNLPEEKKRSLLVEHGIDDFYSPYFFVENGFNLRPTEIIGFLGNSQLPYLDMIIAERQKNYFFAKKLFAARTDLLQLEDAGMECVSSFAIPMLCRKPEIKATMLEKCEMLQIETRPMIAGSIALQPFMSRQKWEHAGLENAAFIHENYFYIGNHESFADDEYAALEDLLA